jgi:DNA-binding MarR family transcriptional regulator
MLIYRTAPTSNFTIFSNELITSAMPPVAKTILLYLLSKPDTWQAKAHDIRKQLDLSAYAVKKALRWLCSAGYAAWVRLKSGHTIWRIFSNPKGNSELRFSQPKTDHRPAIQPQVEIPQVVFQPVLVKIKTEKINKPLPATAAAPIPAPIAESLVVVSDELIYPVQLTDPQKKAAKHIIKKVKEPELQQEVLFALAYAITSGTVKSAPAYLQGLVTRANNGTFEPVTATTASKQGGKPLIPIWQGFGQSSPSKPETATGFIQQAKAALRGAKC